MYYYIKNIKERLMKRNQYWSEDAVGVAGLKYSIKYHNDNYKHIVLPNLKKVIMTKKDDKYITKVYLTNGGMGVSSQAENDFPDPFIGLCVAYTHACTDAHGNSKTALKRFAEWIENKKIKIFDN
jgi:hypothetical protein